MGSHHDSAHDHANGHADPHGVDSWHHHAAAEGEPQAEHGGIVKASVVFLWFLGGIIFLVGTIGVIVLYFDQYSTSQRIELMEVAPAKQFWGQYEAQRDAMVAHVAPQGYELIDPAKGTARPPIEVTMRRVADEYKARQSSSPSQAAPAKK